MYTQKKQNGVIVANFDQTDIEAKKAVLSRIPLSREQLAREEQIAETAAREKRRNVFGAAGFTNATDGSDFAAVDDQMINHESAGTGDWGGCGSPSLPPEEQAMEDFVSFTETFTFDHWESYDWSDSYSPMGVYYATGVFDTANLETQFMLQNTEIVRDEDGNMVFVDTGNSCVNPSSSLGEALIAGKAELEMQELEQAAAETPLDISDPEVAALVTAATFDGDNNIVYNGETVDPNSVEGLRIIQARQYMEAGPKQEAGQTQTADAQPPAPPAPGTQANDATVAAQALTTPAATPEASTTTPADPKDDPEFQALLTKLELTPEQLAAQKPVAAATPVVAPTAAPKFEQAF